jgi:uncharacterized repeat protein (TIGR01451 family)
MKTTLRLSIMFVLVLVQALAPASAGAKAETTTAASMPPALYSAFLDASAKGAPAFHADRSGYSLNTSGMRAGLALDGLSVSPQNGDAWTWNLHLDGFGRQGQAASLSAPEVAQVGGVMQLSYAPLSEWYRETGIGLEQGFTIQQKPAGSGEIVLQMSLDTSLSGAVSADSRSISFAGGKGQVLHYSNLRALDARGRELNARLVYQTGQIAIQIDDQGAAYPLTVDPLIYIEDELFALDGTANDKFGQSVAISGDTALVGVPNGQVGSNSNQGAAYIFLRQGSTWIQQAELSASDGAAGESFGTSVALSGNIALVGAQGYEDYMGRAYVFVKPAGGWASGTQTAILTASDGASGDSFGQSVAISGDSAVIGAPYHNSHQGEAYVFVKPAGGWVSGSEKALLTASDGTAGDYFGQSVAISGNTAVIGAGGHNSNQGEAYVFVKPGSGWATGTENAILTASDGLSGDGFGQSVAISGDTAVIGAIYHNSSQGEAYIFVKPGSGWASGTENAILTASDGLSGDGFGQSVAISGDSAVIGAGGHSSYQGEAYVFVKPASGWESGSETTRLTASDGAANDNFGCSVTTSGDSAFIGAKGNENVAGAAYVYYPIRGEDLSVNAVSSTNSPLIGQTVTFTVSVTNLDPDPSPAVMLSAPLPAGFSLVKSVSRRGSYDPVTAYWDVGSLGGYVTATLQLQAHVTPAAFGTSPVFTAALLGGDPNPGNNISTVAMNPVPYLDISPSSLAFGQQMVGASGPGQVFTVTNQTLGRITFGSLAAPAGFTLSSNTCHGMLGSLAHCSFTVQFTPTKLSAYSGNVSISTTGPIEFTAKMPVSGTGISPLNLRPSSIDFGDVPVGCGNTAGITCPTQKVIVTNLSTDSVTLGSLVVPKGLKVSSNICGGKTLNAFAICTFVLQFIPVSAAVFSGNVSIPFTIMNLHLWITLPVSGNGLPAGPVLKLNPASLTFTGQTIGTTSLAQTVMLSNQSSSSLTFGTFSAPAGFQFSANTCNGKVLAASGTCTFAVQFKPVALAAYSANVTIPVTNPAISFSVHVSGSGVGGTQLLTNASFETDANHDKVPDGWAKGGTWVTADGQDCTTHHTGACSLKLTGTNTIKSLTFTKTKSGVAGDDFLFSVWRKAASVPAGATLDARIQVYSGTTLKATKTVTLPVGTYGFTQSSLPFTMTGTYTKLVVTLEYKGASGTLWFDDASLVWAP